MRAQIALAILGIASAARADPARPSAVELTWSAPSGCPTGERIVAETDRILSGSTVRADPPIRAHARVEARGDGWHLTLETQRGDSAGVRTLDGESCTALAEAMIVILVLMIDPALVPASPPVLEPPPPATPVAKPRPPPPPPPVPPPPPPPPPACRWRDPSLGVAALGDIGTLPRPAAGAAISGGLRRCRWGAVLGAHALAPRTGESDVDAGAGGDLWLLAGSASATLETGPGRLGAAARAGLEAGLLSGRGVGIHNPDAGRAPWLAATAGGAGLLRLTRRLDVRLALDLLVPFTRPRFVIDDLGSVHRPAPLSARLSLGLDLRL